MLSTVLVPVFLAVALADAIMMKRQSGYGQASSGGGGLSGYPGGSSSLMGYPSLSSSGMNSYPGVSSPLSSPSAATGSGGNSYASPGTASGYAAAGSSSFNLYGGSGVIPAQNPNVFAAVDQLRGSEGLSASEAAAVIGNSIPGTSYPVLAYIPQTSFSCSNVRQFGYYADPETRCQVFRRCEANNYMFSYICPNGTLFNQVTLICDWWYNVNCPNSAAWVDYANPRIYRQDLRLFDDVYGSGMGSSGLGGGSYSGSYSGGAGSTGSSGNSYSGGMSGFGGSGSYASGGGYGSQGSSPMQQYRSASNANKVLSEPIPAASEKTLREILAQFTTNSQSTDTGNTLENHNLTTKFT